MKVWMRERASGPSSILNLVLEIAESQISDFLHFRRKEKKNHGLFIGP